VCAEISCERERERKRREQDNGNLFHTLSPLSLLSAQNFQRSLSTQHKHTQSFHRRFTSVQSYCSENHNIESSTLSIYRFFVLSFSVCRSTVRLYRRVVTCEPLSDPCLCWSSRGRRPRPDRRRQRGHRTWSFGRPPSLSTFLFPF
jgi:hypothetical protein